jgi:hypothetical protein
MHPAEKNMMLNIKHCGEGQQITNDAFVKL